MTDEGYLPRDGTYDDGLAAQFVFLSDGATWIREHLYPEMPQGTVFILDFFHAMQHVAKYGEARFGKGTKAGKAWYEPVRAELLGKRRYRRKKSALRKGHRKSRARRRRRVTAHRSGHPHGVAEALARRLLDEDVPSELDEAHNDLVRYLADNADRMDDPSYRSRNMQVGSGAMESLHRVASQARLKLAGARWLPETALGVLRLRMLTLAERWDAFWSGEDAHTRLKGAFSRHTRSLAV